MKSSGWRRYPIVAPALALLLTGFLLCSAVSAAPVVKARILLIKTRDAPFYNTVTQGIVSGLKQRGYRDKTDFVMLALIGNDERDAQAVREQLNKHPQLLITLGTDATRIVAAEKPGIPTLFGMILDPVSLGVVRSLESPGGSFTGTTLLVSPGKQLDALLQAVPRVRRIGVLYTDQDSTSLALLKDARQDADRLKVEIAAVAVKPSETTQQALAGLDGKVDALWLIPDPVSTGQQPMTDTLEFARRRNLPVLGASSSTVRSGALLALSANLTDLGDAIADMTGHVLDGTEKTAEMRVRAPRLTLLTINLDVARSIGIKPPDTMLHLADEVIDSKADGQQ